MTAFTDDIDTALERQAIELPSWAFGDSGTRFRVFTRPGVARTPFERISDAAQVHRHTGLAPMVALFLSLRHPLHRPTTSHTPNNAAALWNWRPQ